VKCELLWSGDQRLEVGLPGNQVSVLHCQNEIGTLQMDFMALFVMGTGLSGGYYITMLPADWSISTPQTLCPLVATVKRCYGIHLLHQPMTPLWG